jgi:hypothetical protein
MFKIRRFRKLWGDSETLFPIYLLMGIDAGRINLEAENGNSTDETKHSIKAAAYPSAQPQHGRDFLSAVFVFGYLRDISDI